MGIFSVMGAIAKKSLTGIGIATQKLGELEMSAAKRAGPTVAKYTGKAGLKIAEQTGYATAEAAGLALGIGDKFAKLGSKMVNENYRMTPIGYTVLAGGLGIAGVQNAANAAEKYDIGSIDGRIHTNTPNYQGYVNMNQQAPAGASGDLVFALDKLKGRGYL